MHYTKNLNKWEHNFNMDLFLQQIGIYEETVEVIKIHKKLVKADVPAMTSSRENLQLTISFFFRVSTIEVVTSPIQTLPQCYL
jgi:hypothetical protein